MSIPVHLTVAVVEGGLHSTGMGKSPFPLISQLVSSGGGVHKKKQKPPAPGGADRPTPPATVAYRPLRSKAGGYDLHLSFREVSLGKPEGLGVSLEGCSYAILCCDCRQPQSYAAIGEAVPAIRASHPHCGVMVVAWRGGDRASDCALPSSRIEALAKEEGLAFVEASVGTSSTNLRLQVLDLIHEYWMANMKVFKQWDMTQEAQGDADLMEEVPSRALPATSPLETLLGRSLGGQPRPITAAGILGRYLGMATPAREAHEEALTGELGQEIDRTVSSLLATSELTSQEVLMLYPSPIDEKNQGVEARVHSKRYLDLKRLFNVVEGSLCIDLPAPQAPLPNNKHQGGGSHPISSVAAACGVVSAHRVVGTWSGRYKPRRPHAVMSRPVLFTLDVDLGGGRSGVVVAHSGDQPRQVALDFLEDEGIECSAGVLDALVHTIQKRMEECRKFSRSCMKQLSSRRDAPASPLREKRE